MADLEWRQPPPASRVTSAQAKQIAEQLRERPGEWARYPQDFGGVGSARAYAYRVRRGDSALGPDIEAEARTREGDTVCDVYVRYKPPPEPEPAHQGGPAGARR